MSVLDATYSQTGSEKDTSLNSHMSNELVQEITKALRSVKGWGSIEIYVQDHNITQITVRNIKKTKLILAE